jgi:glycerol-3-phosphate dehydrogenase (NAD+)
MRALPAEASAADANTLPAPPGGRPAPPPPDAPPPSSAVAQPPSTTPGEFVTPAAVPVAAEAAAAATTAGGAAPKDFYPPDERSNIRDSWDSIMRWSKKTWRDGKKGASALERCDKVAVFGGGSFGTAMAVALARQKPTLDVVMLLRDARVCRDINERHVNERYLPGRPLPPNVRATTSAREACGGAQYALHAVPVQHSRAFLASVKDVLSPDTPIVSVSKGLEVGTGQMLSDLIPSALGRKQPTAFLSGPSFAAEVMDGRPTGLVAASRDKKLGRALQQLLASPAMRVNTTGDVVGVELCGALKNVLAIAAGIVEGLGLGANAKAALVSQGCAEIRWLAVKMGAKPATVAGLSGVGDIMLTCYGELSRNRAVGVRLGRGEALADILASSSQVAEGVATAGVVVGLARRYRVALPVLTAVAQVLDGALSPAEAVSSIMALPQIEER